MNVSTHPGTACGYPDLPQPLKHGAGARVAGTVYAGLGSAGSAWFGLSLAAPSPTWVARAPFPGTPREQAVAVASAGAVYVFGGLGLAADGRSQVLFDDIHRYEPVADAWELLPVHAPVGLLGAAACALADGRILFLGGASKAVVEGFFARLAEAGDDEAQRLAVTRDYLGREPKAYGFNAEALCFDPVTQRWQGLGRLPFAPTLGAAVAREGGCVALVQGELKPGLRSRDAWQARVGATALDWQPLPCPPAAGGAPEPEGLAGAFAGYVDGSLLVAGGTNFPGAWAQYRAGRRYAHEGLAKTWHGDVHALVGGAWRRVGSLPWGLAHGLAFPVPQGLLLVGGERQGGAASAAVQCLRWDGVAAHDCAQGDRP